MTCKGKRTQPLWDSLRKREALEQAERKDKHVEKRPRVANELKEQRK